MKENLNEWRNIPRSWIAMFNIENMSDVHMLICRYNATTIKISILYLFLVELHKLSLYGKVKG